MAEKLTESTWTGFAKKLKLDFDDKALVKALSAFEKTRETDLESRLKTLAEIAKQIPVQVKALSNRKKELGDKVFGEVKDKLYGLLDAAEPLIKETTKSLDAEKKKADTGGDEEEESPVLLTTRMLPLIRDLRKGDVVMQALVATTGKETVVLLSRKAISPARGKLLKEQMTNPGGLKFIRGECLLENKALTFVVQANAGGLAKKIKAALLAQTELRLNVRVRGDDGEEGEEGEEEEDRAATAADASAASKSPDQIAYESRWQEMEQDFLDALKAPGSDASKLRAVLGFVQGKVEAGDFKSALKGLATLATLLGAKPEGAIPAAPPLPPAGGAPKPAAPADADTAAFNARLAALMPAVKEVIAQPGDAGQQVRLTVSEAGTFARKKEFDRANALLDDAEKMLKTPPSGAAPQAAATADLPTRRAAAKVCLEIWRDAKESSDVGLSRLQSALRGDGDPRLQRIAEFGLNGITKRLQVGLRVALEEFASQSDPAGGADRKLRSSVADFRRFLDTDPTVGLCDDNPFGVDVSLRATLGDAMKQIDRQLDALAA